MKVSINLTAHGIHLTGHGIHVEALSQNGGPAVSLMNVSGAVARVVRAVHPRSVLALRFTPIM
jgi:hypothetical protein